MKKIISVFSSAVLALSLLIPSPVFAAAKKTTVKDKVLKGYTVTASSEDNTHPIAHAFDSDTFTYWHSYFEADSGQITNQDKPPFRITMKMKADSTVAGLIYTPRTDNKNGSVKKYNVYITEKGKTEEKLVCSGTMPGDETESRVVFDAPVKAMSVIFEITDSVGSFGSCSELKLLSEAAPDKNKTNTNTGTSDSGKTDTKKGETTKVIVSDFTVEASSEDNTHTIAQAFDSDTSTYWHSYYEAEGSKITYHDEPPMYITMTFKNTATVSGIKYTPRQEGDTGRILGYNLYGFDDKKENMLLFNSGTFKNNTEAQTVDLMVNVKVKGLVLEITSSRSGYGSAAEIEILRENKNISRKADSAKAFADEYEKVKLHPVNTENFKAYAESVWGTSGIHIGAMAFDGKNTTYWHSDPENKKYPYYLDLDMGAVHEITAFDYTPRYDGFHGHWFDFTLLVSSDGATYTEYETFNIPEEKDGFDVVSFTLKVPVKTRYVRFRIDKAKYDFASCSDIVFYETYESSRGFAEARMESYTLTVGKNTIEAENSDGKKEITLDVSPLIDSGRTLIPLRGLLEAMGAEVAWNGDEEKITVTKGETVIELQNMNNLVYVKKSEFGNVKTVRYTLDVPPKIMDSRTFIPIRFVSEHLGYAVSWDGEKSEIKITNK